MKTAKIIRLVFGSLCIALGLILLTFSAFFGWAYFKQANEGQFATATQRLESPAHALVSRPIDLFEKANLPLGFSLDGLASVMLRVTSAPSDSDKEVFVGIAPRQAVDYYLSNVARTVVTDIEFGSLPPSYRQIAGERKPETPAAQLFWSTSSNGTGTQEVKWELKRGSWTAVVMNADGDRDIAVDVQFGVRLEFLGPLTLGVLLISVAMLTVGILLAARGRMGHRRG